MTDTKNEERTIGNVVSPVRLHLIAMNQRRKTWTGFLGTLS